MEGSMNENVEKEFLRFIKQENVNARFRLKWEKKKKKQKRRRKGILSCSSLGR